MGGGAASSFSKRQWKLTASSFVREAWQGPLVTSLGSDTLHLTPGAQGTSMREQGEKVGRQQVLPGEAEQTGRKDGGITQWNRRFAE